MDRVLAPAPANGAALNVSTGAQCSSKAPHRVELLGAPQGGQKQERSRAYGFYSVLSPAFSQHPVRSTQHSLFPFLFPLLFPVTPSRRDGPYVRQRADWVFE